MAARHEKTAGAGASAHGRHVEKIRKSFSARNITANDIEAIGVAFIAGGFCIFVAILIGVAS